MSSSECACDWLPENEVLRLFPYEPSGRYIVNIQEHHDPAVFYDENAEIDYHIHTTHSYIDYLVESENISYPEAIRRAQREYLLAEGLVVEDDVNSKLTYTSPIIPTVPQLRLDIIDDDSPIPP